MADGIISAIISKVTAENREEHGKKESFKDMVIHLKSDQNFIGGGASYLPLMNADDEEYRWFINDIDKTECIMKGLCVLASGGEDGKDEEFFDRYLLSVKYWQGADYDWMFCHLCRKLYEYFEAVEVPAVMLLKFPKYNEGEKSETLKTAEIHIFICAADIHGNKTFGERRFSLDKMVYFLNCKTQMGISIGMV